MEDSYISNIAEGDQSLELELLDKVNQLEIDCEKYRQDCIEFKKENLELKHRVQDLEIDMEHNLETIKNQNGIIKFYKQYRAEHEEEGDQKKVSELEEKIKSLEESLLIKDKKIEDLNKELKEVTALNEKFVDVITNKEEAIRKLEKGNNMDEDDTTATINKLEEEIEKLQQRISDLQNEKENIVGKYDDKIEDLNKENNDYQEKIYDLEKEILNLKEINKKYEIDEIRQKGGPDTENEVDKLYKEQIENLQNALNDAKESKKEIKKKAQEQRDSDLKEIAYLEKELEDSKYKIKQLKSDKQSLDNDKINLKSMNEKLLKRNKELESIFGDHSDNELILSNYKQTLNKKNNEIYKCNEFKENLDQYEKNKDITVKKLQHEKDVLQSEIEDKTKKLEVALRELNELRAKEGKGEANMDQLMEDPKQKLYDEIKEYKKKIENKDKEINELKNKLANFEIDSRNELEAQTEYLNNSIELLNKNIENMKEQKRKVTEDFKKQIETLEMEMGDYKCQLATLQFEMDRKLFTYKQYIKKLQKKLESLGFKFKDKNEGKTRMRSKTLV